MGERYILRWKQPRDRCEVWLRNRQRRFQNSCSDQHELGMELQSKHRKLASLADEPDRILSVVEFVGVPDGRLVAFQNFQRSKRGSCCFRSVAHIQRMQVFVIRPSYPSPEQRRYKLVLFVGHNLWKIVPCNKPTTFVVVRWLDK